MTAQILPEDLNSLRVQKAVKVLDGSWALDGTDMYALYLQDHIPGAQFFDLDAISDHSTPLPHMAPSAQQFAQAVGQLGISETDHVVIYDRQGLFSAARVWWTFKLMGHDQVQVLRGGLPAWKAANLPTHTESHVPAPTLYTPAFQPEKLISMQGLVARLEAPGQIILDARPKARFEGTAPEPRAGLRSGHMPGSTSLPATELIANGALKTEDQLQAIFADLGVDKDQTVVTTCGSGVTAAIIALALHEIGHAQTELYDGSWAEWGQAELDTPVV